MSARRLEQQPGSIGAIAAEVREAVRLADAQSPVDKPHGIRRIVHATSNAVFPKWQNTSSKAQPTGRNLFQSPTAVLSVLIPWASLLAVIEPFYPKGERGRPPIGLERMLRVYCLQQWYALADEALEDALYDSQALQRFARIDLAAEGVPDATTLLKFRRLLETHDLCKGLFTAINADLTARGLLLKAGTLVDATLIAAPSSTKNQKKERDPQMHQTKKGKQWYFGMKAHIGADRDSKLVHTVVVTAANVADVTKTAELLHGKEQQVHADAGYTGVEKRPEIVALEQKIDWQIARKRGLIKALAEGAEKEALRAVEKTKASVRAFVEHPFHIVKNLFRHRKVRYRGLTKNGHQLYTLFGLANVLIGGRTGAKA